MKKQKVDITKLSDEELIKYYRTNRNIYKISNIAYPAGSFLVSGLLSNQQAYVFVPAVTAYLALGGVQIFSVCNRITKKYTICTTYYINRHKRD